MPSPAAAGRLAETILEALRATSDAPETNSISTSIGIALCPDDAADRETLLSHADTALYRAKSEGRNTYRFFEAAMGAEVRERRLLEHDLRLAIARDELRLAYQPQQDIRSKATTGFEALLRWKHPTRGEISPAVFIPIAEETGAILEIGDWVMKTACREAATWTQPLTVAVNVSAVQLYNADFVKELHQILLETGLPPRRLEIEITETALVRDFNRALATLRQIKALGVRIAMDDFGTGYSSLSNLRAFPFDKIKIDGSFIKSVHANDQAATIVRAVLGLGRGLGLPVLAEGVETAAELQFLRDELCDEVQGYLLGRPAAIGSFRELTHADAALDVIDDLLVVKKRLTPRSALQLQDRHVGVTNSHAQFAPQRRQQLDRDIRLLPAQHGERRLAQAKAGEVFVDRDGGRARPAVEQRQFAEHRASREGNEPDVAAIVPEMHAGAARGDEIERRAGIAAPENDMACRPRHRLQPAAQPLDLVGGEIAEQRQAVERQFERLPGSGVPEQIVLGPFDGAIDIGEKRGRRVKDVGKPRGSLGAAGQDQRQPEACARPAPRRYRRGSARRWSRFR